jgi:hypothetical protein
VRTDKEVGGKDGETLFSDKSVFLSASEKNFQVLKGTADRYEEEGRKVGI